MAKLKGKPERVILVADLWTPLGFLQAQKPKKRRKKGSMPTEAQEQSRVVGALRTEGVPVFAVPNNPRSKIHGAQLRKQGLAAGVPDLVLPQPSPKFKVPTAIEMKRRKGGRVSDNQKKWHRILERDCGWKVYVCQGADEAFEVLRMLGYLPKSKKDTEKCSKT
jgi:hypothetical protein